MEPLLALFYVFLVYSIGDYIADKTKAFVSMFLVSAAVFLVSFWCGMPKTLFADSGLLGFCKVTICMVMIHIGSSIRFNDFVKEWRTVIVALLVTIAVSMGVFFIGRTLIDRYYALMSAPIVAGATISYLIMKPLAEALGRTDVQVFGVLVLVTQSFIGIPISSYFCKKEGDRFMAKYRAGELITQKNLDKTVDLRLFRIPEKFSTANIIICKLALMSYFCAKLGEMTGINFMIFGLLAGVLFHAVGLLEENCLTKANGFAFTIAAVYTLIFMGLADTTPQMLLDMIAPLAVVLAIGTTLCVVAAAVIGALAGLNWKFAIGLAAACFFGFPGTYLISMEVSNACGADEEEKKAVLAYMMPKLIISGIVSVSVVSGLVASVMVHWR